MKNRIKEVREDNNLSQEAFCKIFNISRPKLIRIEKGGDISLRLAWDICMYFGFKLEDIFDKYTK